MSRATTVYVNKIQPSRIWQTEVFRAQQRRITVNYRALLGDALITSATVTLTYPPIIVMSNLSIAAGQKSVSLTINANLEGACVVRVEATTDDNQVLTQMLIITVLETPWVEGDLPATTGPARLTVSV